VFSCLGFSACQNSSVCIFPYLSSPGLGRGRTLKRASSFDDMALLCSMYSEVELFIWLQNKFPPINLMEQQAALARKDVIASYINLGLKEAESLRLKHSYIQRDVLLRSTWEEEQADLAARDGLETDDDSDEEEADDESELRNSFVQ